MSKISYRVHLVFGRVFCLLHRKQFSKNSIFYGIPRINRADRLICGDYLKVNGNVFINADGGVKIGNSVTLSYGATIIAASYESNSFFQGKRIHSNKGIEIGNNVWIGANATILDGVHICDHVIIGAGSVVTHDIQTPYSVYAGVPARLINTRDHYE